MVADKVAARCAEKKNFGVLLINEDFFLTNTAVRRTERAGLLVVPCLGSGLCAKALGALREESEEEAGR